MRAESLTSDNFPRYDCGGESHFPIAHRDASTLVRSTTLGDDAQIPRCIRPNCAMVKSINMVNNMTMLNSKNMVVSSL